MAIQVFCNCGNSLSVGVELAGKKVRCKACSEVLKIPDVPLDESAEDEPTSGPDDYEVITRTAQSIACPTCGAAAAPEDTACLACGAELEVGGSLGALNKIPRPVLLGVIGAVALLVAGFVGKSAWTATRPGAYVSDGYSLLEAEDYGGAAQAFKEALTYDPGHPEALVGLASTGVAAKDSALLGRYAKRVLEKNLIDDDRERAKLRLAYAWVLLEEKKPKRAQNQAVEAKDEDSGLEGEAYAVMGLAALERGEDEDALDSLQKARSKRFEDVRVYWELALLRKKREEFSEGLSAVEKAVKLKNDDAALWLLTAELRALVGDRPGEAEALRETIKLDGKNALAHSRLASSYLLEEKLDMALESAKTAADLAPGDAEVLIALGRILLASGSAEEAKAPLERALEIQADWKATFLLGKALVQTDDTREGMSKILAALKKQPEDMELRLEAAQIALEAGDAKRGAAILVKVIEQQPGNYDARVLLADALARKEHGRGKHDAEIRQHLEAAIQADSRRREAPLALGMHLFELLEPESAIEAFDTGLKANSRDRDLLFYKGWACIRARRWDDAIEALQKCLKTDPKFQDAKEKLEEAEEGKFYRED